MSFQGYFDQALFGDSEYEVFRAEQRLKFNEVLEGYKSRRRDFKEKIRHKGYKALAVAQLLRDFQSLEERGEKTD